LHFYFPHNYGDIFDLLILNGYFSPTLYLYFYCFQNAISIYISTKIRVIAQITRLSEQIAIPLST